MEEENLYFPDPTVANTLDGLLAIGGDLSPERLWFAYRNGIFPWFNPGEEIAWWSPDPRFVLFPDKIKVSKSMAKVLRNNEFQFTENQCFRTVMENCMNVQRKDQDGTWISEELINSYEKLYLEGKAKSIEVWKNSALVGGFYGVLVGNVFCGESMFSKVSNASKAGFLDFVTKNQSSLVLIDCQIHSPHLESLGAEMISGEEFLKILKKNQ